jgi:hypothetical protein
MIKLKIVPRIIFLPLLLVVCLLFIKPQTIHALSSPRKATITPFLQQVTIAANEMSKKIDISLTNNTDKTQTYRLSVLDFGSLNDSGGIVFAGSNASSLISKYGLATWIKLKTSVISLDAGKMTDLGLTLEDDGSMQPGGHYAAVIASLDSPGSVSSAQVDINQQLSALILATKLGGEKYDLKLDKTDLQTSTYRLPTHISLHFSNPGNVHVVPRGTVRLLTPNGKIISQGIINEDSVFILPETARQLKVSFNKVARQNWWPTTYRIEINYRYDGYDSFATKTLTIHYVNLPALVLTALLLIGLLSTVYWQIHRRNLEPKIMKFIRSLFINKGSKASGEN